MNAWRLFTAREGGCRGLCRTRRWRAHRAGQLDQDRSCCQFIGTTIEWYDFFLYGTAAALVFNKLFFPELDPAVGTIAAFATYGVGFFARPFAGVVFGHLGDRIGRKAVLVTTLMLMGLATFAVGLLPTYDSIGILAPILLVVVRFIQGLGIGGEWGSAVLMAVEHAPKGKRGFYGSWPQTGVPAGLLLSTTAFATVQALTSEAAFLAWGWRIPFLVSAVLVGVGLFIRLRIEESPAFRQLQETEAASPIREVLRSHPRRLLAAVGMRVAENVYFPLLTVFVLTYGVDEAGIAKGTLLTGVIIAAALGLVAIPGWAALSDRIGRRPVYATGAVFSLLFIMPFFWLVDTGTPVLIWLAIVLAVNVGHNLMYAPQATYFAELFATRVRCSGVSLAYQVTSAFAGGLAPLIATLLLAANGGRPELVAAYAAATAVITIIALALAPETYRDDIEPEAAPRQRRSTRTTQKDAVAAAEPGA